MPFSVYSQKHPSVHGVVDNLGNFFWRETGGKVSFLRFTPAATSGRFKDESYDHPKQVYPVLYQLYSSTNSKAVSIPPAPSIFGPTSTPLPTNSTRSSLSPTTPGNWSSKISPPLSNEPTNVPPNLPKKSLPISTNTANDPSL